MFIPKCPPWASAYLRSNKHLGAGLSERAEVSIRPILQSLLIRTPEVTHSKILMLFSPLFSVFNSTKRLQLSPVPYIKGCEDSHRDNEDPFNSLIRGADEVIWSPRFESPAVALEIKASFDCLPGFFDNISNRVFEH